MYQNYIFLLYLIKCKFGCKENLTFVNILLYELRHTHMDQDTYTKKHVEIHTFIYLFTFTGVKLNTKTFSAKGTIRNYIEVILPETTENYLSHFILKLTI